MSDSQFEDLLGNLLDGELSAEDWSRLIELIRQNPARQREVLIQLEAAELLSLSEDELRQGSLFLAGIKSRENADLFVGRVRDSLASGSGSKRQSRGGGLRPRPARMPWLVSALAASVAVVALCVALWPRGAAPAIARLAEVNGSLRWIGEEGRVVSDLKAGMSLTGGTLDAMASDAYAQLVFKDGSIVTVAGPSLLTISELEQKSLYLREGKLFAKVSRQAQGKPMLIHTQTAKLEVVGTRLNVEAASSETRLNVNEGRVRVTRLVDGSVAEVSALHQVVATASREEALNPILRPEPVNHWESNLMASLGRWLPPDGELGARLQVLPIILNRPREGPLAIFLAGFDASQCGMPPVLLESGARFRIQARIKSVREIHFEITTRTSDGRFGGKFGAIVPAAAIPEAGQPFEVSVRLDDMRAREHWMADSAVGTELEDCGLFTIDVDAGLEITRVELLPP